MSGRQNPPTDNAPPNAPPGCPRRWDYSSGPRRCAELACPLHLRMPSTKGRAPSAARVRLAVLVEDTCAVDVAERVRAANDALTLDEIGVLLGVSRQAAAELLASALRKVRIALRVRYRTDRSTKRI